VTDAAVAAAAKKFVTIIIRVPHADGFTKKLKVSSIPGMTFMDSSGNECGSYVMGRTATAKALLEEMNRHAK